MSANKPPTSKKLRIVEVVRPLVPGGTTERFVEGPNNKKLDCYIGNYHFCDVLEYMFWNA